MSFQFPTNVSSTLWTSATRSAFRLLALPTIAPSPTACSDRYVVSYPPSSPGATSVFTLTTALTAWSVNTASFYPEHDPSYISCQPLSTIPSYSPGMCPEGQTLAGMTEFSAFLDDGPSPVVNTFWQGNCCKSGMIFSESYCRSSVTTDIAVFTLTWSPTVTYDSQSLTTTSYTLSLDSFSARSTITAGSILADPVVVFWETKDIATFPSAYSKALESYLNLTTPGPTSETTNTPAPSPGPKLSGGAIAGIVIGGLVALVALGILIFLLRRRQVYKKQRQSMLSHQDEHQPDMSMTQ